jgi:transposase-like protein
LGLWLSPTEGAKLWLGCLTDLKNRRLQDVFIVCVDGLTGFAEVIWVAYPQAKVKLCLVHLVRAALRRSTQPNAIESVNSVIRKFTRNRKQHPAPSQH